MLKLIGGWEFQMELLASVSKVWTQIVELQELPFLQREVETILFRFLVDNVILQMVTVLLLLFSPAIAIVEPAVDGTSTAGTVCTNHRPFKVSFKTDSVEYTNGDNEGGDIARARGFELNYYMKTTCLTRPTV